MFAIDSLGALVSSLMLGIILPILQPLIGMPNVILFALAAIALCLSVYSFCCYRWANVAQTKWLKGIIFANTSYCILTAVLLFTFREQVTLLGGIYFISEIIIIICIVLLERSVIQNTYKVGKKGVNSHWIPRLLTREWEYKKGKFKYLCFSEMKILEADSADLFAEQGLFSEDEEAFFNKYFETPISHIVKTMESGDVKIRKWKVYRSVVLFLFHLVARYNAKYSGTEHIEKFVSMSEADLDVMVKAILTQYDILKLDINPNSRMVFPSTCIFPATGVDEQLNDYCHFCVPITGTAVLCMARKGYSQDHLKQLCRNFNFHNLSVTNSKNCNKVLLHPDMLEIPEEELVPKIIETRAMNDHAVESYNKLIDTLGRFSDYLSSIGFQTK